MANSNERRCESLQLRFNHALNCWQVYNYLGRYSRAAWKWFSITANEARSYANVGVPVNTDATVVVTTN